jgi:hypothetical protein
MKQPRTCLWLSAHVSAVLETNNARMPTRIYEALAAIEERRPSLTATDDIEERVLSPVALSRSVAESTVNF